MNGILVITLTDGVGSIDAEQSTPGLSLETLEAAQSFLARMIALNVTRQAILQANQQLMAEAQQQRPQIVVPGGLPVAPFRAAR